ncbi:MAG: response regulator [Desulfuromusa sp.]|jgi:DNA-binding response OmpR family regulator|nr:response regulator [Desulfuromusa sp.]
MRYQPEVSSILHHNNSADRPAQSDLSAIAFGHGETILLADCNENLLKLGCSLLTKLNYQVVTASNEKQVIKQFTSTDKKIDLLILDTDIPREEGQKFIDEMTTYQPHAKALFYTVCDALIDPVCRKKIGSAPVISKPYSIRELSRVIYQTLYTLH